MSTSMSRIGRKPVAIPPGIVVKMIDGLLAIKGPKGQSTIALHPFVQVGLEDNQIKLTSKSEGNYYRKGSGAKLYHSIVGTLRAKIFNMITGVTKGFERKLILVGVGYRAQAKGNVLNLTLGFSHPVNFSVPEGIVIETPSQTEIVIRGADKHLVGHVASTIRAIRSPEPYKGKGVRYSDEVIVIKETKKK